MPNKLNTVCGHELAKGDLHNLFYTCRNKPKKAYPRLHACQTVKMAEGVVKGNAALCSICCVVSQAVRDTWAPRRSYEDI